jgi:hypothetical protein
MHPRFYAFSAAASLLIAELPHYATQPIHDPEQISEQSFMNGTDFHNRKPLLC